MPAPFSRRRIVFLILGPVAAVVVAILTAAAGLPALAWKTAAIATLCAFWWMTEPISLPATALLPFALLPMAGVMNHREVASAFGNPIVLLLLSGFVLSKLLEGSGAHRRLAVLMVRLVGGSSYRRLVLAFMVATAALSMWIANTAVALMMLPLVAAVYEGEEHRDLAAPLLLGVCYAANIGGMGTPIGTPPIPVFMAAYEDVSGTTIAFTDWMTLGVPMVLILMVVAWWVVTRGMPRGTPVVLQHSGAWTRREVLVLVLFGLTALAWVTRQDPMGGWTGLLGLVDADGKALVGDSTVGLFFIILAFFIPDGRGSSLLEWKTVEKIPWGLLVLVGGGVALARGFSASGLSTALGSAMSGVAGWSLILTVMTICLAVSFMTELTSNTATATLLMPIAAAAAIGLGVDPGMIMVPVVLACGCAFMLPVATGPNAIVYGTGHVPIGRMVRNGLMLNFVAIVLISVVCIKVLPSIL